MESEVAGDAPQFSDVDGAENGLRSGAGHLPLGAVGEGQQGAVAAQPCGASSGAAASPSVFTVRLALRLCRRLWSGACAAAAAWPAAAPLWTQVCAPM